jgi:hypothetical protein
MQEAGETECLIVSVNFSPNKIVRKITFFVLADFMA